MQITTQDKEAVAKKFQSIRSKLYAGIKLDEGECAFVCFMLDQAQGTLSNFWFFQKMF